MRPRLIASENAAIPSNGSERERASMRPRLIASENEMAISMMSAASALQ